MASRRSGRGLPGSGLHRDRRAPPGCLPGAAAAPGPAADDADAAVRRPADDGRRLLGPQTPAAARTRAQLLLVQRLDGGLTIGDTHEYGEPFGFDVDEDAYDHLRARAETLLGAPLPPVQRRWAGVYSQVTGDELYHRAQIEPGVVLVTGPGGRGMTCSPAIAEETYP